MGKKHLFGILFFFLVFAAGGIQASKTKDFHGSNSQKNCVKCHIEVPPEGSNPRAEGNLRFKGNIDEICSECHENYKHDHPVKLVISPAVRGTESLPLDKEGRIVCITCHDVMEKIDVHRKKIASGRELCLSCHVDADLFAQIIWYPTHLRKGETGRLEIKVVEFNLDSEKQYMGDTVLLYFYAKDIDSGSITFGTNVLYDDGTHGDRTKGDAIYTLTEKANVDDKVKRLVYTGWILNSSSKRSNTVTLAIEYEK